MQKRILDTVKKTVNLINKELEQSDIHEYVSSLLYSIGGSIEEKNYKTSEDVMMDYYSSPTFGKALMAQSLIIRDKWVVEKEDEGYHPIEISPPGDTIEDLIEEKNLDLVTFSKKMNLSLQTVENLIKGKIEITKEIAKSLEEVFSVPSSFWEKRELNYRDSLDKVNKT